MSRLIIYDCNITLNFSQGLPLDEWHESLNVDDIVVLRDVVNSKHLIAHRLSACRQLTFGSFNTFSIPVWCSSRHADALKYFDSIMKYAEKYDLSMRIEIPLTDASLQRYHLNPRWERVDVFRCGNFFGIQRTESTWYYQAVFGKMSLIVYPSSPLESKQEHEHFLDRMLVHSATPRRDYFFAINHTSDVFRRDLYGELVGRRSGRSNKIPELQCFEGDFFIYRASLMERTKDALHAVDIAIADGHRRRNRDLPPPKTLNTNENLLVYYSSAGTLAYSNYTVESHVKRSVSEPVVVIISAPDRVLRFENINTSQETIAVSWHPTAKWREPWCRACITELILSIGGLLVPHAIFESIEWLDCLRTWSRFKLMAIIDDVYRSVRQIVARRRVAPVTRLRLKMKK